MKLTVPNLTQRRGGFYWEPGPRDRPHWPGRMLKTPSGGHMLLTDAVAASEDLNRQLNAWRAAGRTRQRHVTQRAVARSVEHLAREWCGWPTMQSGSVSWRNLSPRTQKDYINKLKVFLEQFGEHHVAAIRKAHLYKFWEHLHATRGTRMAQGVIQVASSMLAYATRIGWIETNPALRLGMETPKPRQMLWLPDEIAHLCSTASRMGEHGVRTAIIVALHSAQRQGDVLALPNSVFTETVIRLTALDRIAVRQSKRGARVDAPMTPQLMAAVRAQRQHNARLDVVPMQLIVDDRTGCGYNENTFRSRFAAVRAVAAARHPAITHKTFQDLRDTAVTRLSLAGCDLLRISAISGHSPKTIQTIIQHYLVLQPELANEAISRLSLWLDTNAIAI